MSAALPAEEFTAWLKREGAERYHDHHRYHVLMHAGKLTQLQLQQWVLNRYYYQTRIPIKDALILSKSDDPAFRRMWIRRIQDHDGTAQGEGGLDMWLRLAQGVGLDREEVRSCRAVLPGVIFACDAYVQLVRERSLIEAVASSLTEFFAPDIMSKRILAWEAHYPWVAPEMLAYFRARVTREARFGRSARFRDPACEHARAADQMRRGADPQNRGTLALARYDVRGIRRSGLGTGRAPRLKPGRRKMDASLYILLGLVIAALVAAFVQDVHLPLRGIAASGRLLRSVWIEITLGFLLAGLIEVLVPAQAMAQWLGRENLGRGILVGWAAGLILPGGPYMLFPIAANLIRTGAEPGPVIALLTAKTLVSPIRMFTYEAPLLGWPITLARFIPGVLLPPVLGYLGQWLYTVFKR